MDEVRARYTIIEDRLSDLNALLAGHLSSMRRKEYQQERRDLEAERDELIERYPEVVEPVAPPAEPEPEPEVAAEGAPPENTGDQPR